MNTILTMLGFGALGVLVRYEVHVIFTQRWPEHSHLGTFAVNVIGSFIMGVVYVLSLEKTQISDEMRMAIMVGFLGGLTTYSSYALESIRLLEAGNAARTFFYVALTPALSIVFCFLGLITARKYG